MMETFYTITANRTIGELLNKSFTINPGKYSPYVHFDSTAGTLIIKGNSTDLAVSNQLIPLIALVNEYLNTNNQMTCTLQFEDFNTSTCKLLFKLFKVLEHHRSNDKVITINWFVAYEYEEILDTGLDFAALFDLNFNVEYAASA